MDEDFSNASAIQLFKEYVQVKTYNDVEVAVEAFLLVVSIQCGLDFERVDQRNRDGISRPIFILTLRGREPSVGSLLLLGHVDMESSEHYPDVVKLKNGRIYWRGTEMSTRNIWFAYLCALDRLVHRQKTPSKDPFVPLFRRTVHIRMIVSTEKRISGGTIAEFVISPKFQELLPAFAPDVSSP